MTRPTEIKPEPAVETVASAPEAKAGASEGTPARKWWQLSKPKEKKPKRPVLLRLFGVGVWGAIKLVMLCILVGFVLLAMDFDPAAPGFDVTDAMGAFLKNAWATGRWAMTNFWKPALAGAGIVLPLWVLWRLVTLPFRR